MTAQDSPPPIIPPPVPAFDWGIVPKDALEAKQAEIRSNLHSEVYNSVLGRVVGEELKTRDLAEAKRLIELGKKSGIPAPPAELSVETKQIMEANVALEKSNTEMKASYSQTVMKEKLSNAYLTAGGRPSTEESKATEQAVTLMISEGMFEVDSSFELKAKSGITVSQAVDLWLKRNPHFAKLTPPPIVPPPPGTGTPTPNPIQKTAMDFFSNALKGH
jgi:hypothetical protein